MRVAGIAKAGFYPTPDSVVRLIAQRLTKNPRASVLDPCAGEGRAADALTQLGTFREAWGIELEADRAKQANTRLDQVICGNSLNYTGKGFSLLYLNPPYDNGDGERLELSFLRHWYKALRNNGILVFIIPEYVLEVCKSLLTTWFSNLAVFRFPPKEYGAYKQVVVFGIKNREAGENPWPEIEPFPDHHVSDYLVPDSGGANLWNAQLDPQEITREARSSSLYNLFRESVTRHAVQGVQPLLPLRIGHLALMVAGGLFDGQVIEHNGQRLLLRGRVLKVEETETTDEATITRERYTSEIGALDLLSGHLMVVS